MYSNVMQYVWPVTKFVAVQKVLNLKIVPCDLVAIFLDPNFQKCHQKYITI